MLNLIQFLGGRNKKSNITRLIQPMLNLPRFNGHQNQTKDEVSDAEIQQTKKDFEVQE